jgi:hypothetical protein
MTIKVCNLLEENNTPHGSDNLHNNQQNERKFYQLPGKAQIASIPGQKIDTQRNCNRNQTQGKEQTDNQHDMCTD